MKYFLPSAIFVGAWAATAFAANTTSSSSKPNVVFILTDDQDLQMNSMDYMGGVKTHLTDQGTYFAHHFATISLCCPSRVNMWTGKAAHNTNVTDLHPPFGGYPKFLTEGYYDKWLPTWLQAAGYKTYYTGKLMNGHTVNNYQEHLNNLSLDGHDFQIEPGTYQYLNTTFQHNGENPQSYPGLYATDLLANKSLAWIDEAADSSAPFFLAINPVNPHDNLNWKNGTDKPAGWSAPIPAERYQNLFPNETVPRNDAFNPNRTSGASWITELPMLNNSDVKYGDDYYRRRLQALQAVDDLVNRTVARLEQYNLLDNTYIIYTSDNGFHIGQHRLTPGKRCPYEEDVSVPLVIRGPGVPKGATVDFVTSHTDLAPTVVDLAGAKGPADFDGVPIPLKSIGGTGSNTTDASGSGGNGTATNSTKPAWEHVQIEFWGSAKDGLVPDHGTINTYKALRVIGSKYNLYYSVWCDGSHEVYDMTTDPHQMNNLYNSTQQFLGVSMPKLENRLDALTLVMKTCKGKTCYDPWGALDPSGQTKTLQDALDPKYDTFYQNQNKVKYEQCAPGYFIGNEMPINYMTFGNHSSVQERNAEALYNWKMFTD